MGKRIYSDTNRRLYRYRVGGNFYVLEGSSEICLETPYEHKALAHLEVHERMASRYGSQSFKWTVGELFPKFLKKKKRDVRERTYDTYLHTWEKYLKRPLSKTKLVDMDQREWSRFCTKTKQVSDFQNHKNLMVHFLKWCVMHKYLTALPVIQNPKHKRRKRKVLPPKHLAMIFQHAEGSLLLFISLAVFMGMRRREIITLTWDRVDLVHRSLILGDEDTKTDDGRQIPIAAVVHALLLKRMAAQQSERKTLRYIFPNAKTARKHADVSGLKTAWRTCLKRSALVGEYTWHDLRATYEKYSHKSAEHTDTQREKMVGADIDVQRKTYVSMNADDLRGLEEVVSRQLPELQRIISRKTLGRENLKLREMAVANENH